MHNIFGGDIMTNNDYWQEFERSGKIGDYLKYALDGKSNPHDNEPAAPADSDRDVINIDNC